MESIDIIAACMVCLTAFTVLVCLVLLVIGLRVMRTLGKVDVLMASARTEAMPILNEARKISENLRDVSVMVKHQAGKSEPMVENTLKNIQDMSHRLKETVDSATSVFMVLGKVANLLRGK